MITLSRSCPNCGKICSVQVHEKDLLKWKAGMLVQNAFPYLTADEREVIFLSGFCNKCWDSLMKPDDE